MKGVLAALNLAIYVYAVMRGAALAARGVRCDDGASMHWGAVIFAIGVTGLLWMYGG